MAEKPMSPEEVARQRLQEQEESERQRKLDTLTSEERQRRETADQERQREERRAAAEERAAELAQRRADLEGQAEARMLALKNVLHEFQEVDSEYRSAARESGKSLGGAGYQTVDQAVAEWVRDTLLRDTPRLRSLQAIDLLTASAESPQRRSPAPGLPGSDPKDAPRRNAASFLEKLEQRATMLRRQFNRDLRLEELLGDGERDVYEALSEEQREQVQSWLGGEGASVGS